MQDSVKMRDSNKMQDGDEMQDSNKMQDGIKMQDSYEMQEDDNKKVSCPCCGSLTLSENNAAGEICPVCFWENDRLQNADETLAGGANKVSLSKARENYKQFGACEERFAAYTRKPVPAEISDETGDLND